MSADTLTVGTSGYLSIPAELIEAAELNTRPRELVGCAVVEDQILIALLRPMERGLWASSALTFGVSVRKDGSLKVPPEILQPLGLGPGQQATYSVSRGLIWLEHRAGEGVVGL